MNEEPATIRNAVSRITGSAYEFEEPTMNFPASAHGVSWMLVSRIPLQGRTTAVAPTIWEDKVGTLFVESIQLADISEWIAEMYGEKGSEKSSELKPEYSKANPEIVLKKHFPRVRKRLLQYEGILSRVSSKCSVELQVEYSVNRFVVTVHALIRFAAKDLGTQAKIERIKLSIDAIKEAISEIDKYEAERARSGR